MEEEGEKHKSHPMLKPLYFPVELKRTPEIIKDLEFYYGEDWKDEIKPLEATKKFMARLKQLGEEDPMLLVAHQYTRYMGDFGGGQILKKVFFKAYHLFGSNGICFYEFDNIPNLVKFKELYRSRLDSLQLSKEDADRMVNESLRSFQFHIDMFIELAELCGIKPDPRHEMQSEPLVKEPTTIETVGHDGSDSSGVIFAVFGFAVALLAILYSYLLA